MFIFFSALAVVSKAASFHQSDYIQTCSDDCVSTGQIVSNENLFPAFVHGLKLSNNMLETPFYSWLVPEWRKVLQMVEIPNGDIQIGQVDEDFGKDLQFLVNPDIMIAEESKELGEHMVEHLKSMGKRIALTLKWARENVDCNNLGYWYDGLKDLASRLRKNAKIVPSLLDDLRAHAKRRNYREGKWGSVSHRYAYIAGLNENLNHSRRPGLLSDSTKVVLESGHEMKYDPLTYAWGIARAIELSGEVQPYTNGQLSQQLMWNLFLISESYDLPSAAISPLVKLLPIGQRMALGFKSSSGLSSMIDFVRHEDGHVYGLKFATSDYFHSPSISFRMPFDAFPNLLDYLSKDYDSFSDIGSVKGVEWQAVDLKWYPAVVKRDPVGMLQTYAAAWNIGNRVKIGILWSVFQLACRKEKPDDLNENGLIFWLKLIEQLTREEAEAIWEKIKSMESQSDSNQFKHFVGAFRRKLLAQLHL